MIDEYSAQKIAFTVSCDFLFVRNLNLIKYFWFVNPLFNILAEISQLDLFLLNVLKVRTLYITLKAPILIFQPIHLNV